MIMATTRGVLFANDQQRVIFVDSNLQRMLQFAEADLAYWIGEPVHKLLGIAAETYNDITQRLQRSSRIEGEPLELHDQNGNLLSVSVDFIANRNLSGKLVGVDFVIRRTQQDTAEAESTAAAAQPSASAISSKMAEEVVRFYFKRQLEGFHEVITRVGGKRLGEYLATSITTTANENGWPVEVSGHTIDIHSETLPFDAYQGLMFKAASVTSTAIGNKLVSKQIAEIDERTNPKTFEFIQQNWFQQLS